MNKCVIIDDEPLAIDVLKVYIEKSALVEIAATFTSPSKALSYIQKNPVDIVFLDINMPKLTGFDIIRSLPVKPAFIITSAYREYALDGYELDILDFLIKPISYERFLKSMAKFLRSTAGAAHPSNSRFIFIRENKRTVKIVLSDILYLESQKDHVKIITTSGAFVTRNTISFYEEWLSKTDFVRVHRSFIVPVSKIHAYTEEEIDLATGTRIPIGESYRKNFKQSLQKPF